MRRYFFHIRDGRDFIRDDVGGFFNNLSEAHGEALSLARSFARDMGDIGAGVDEVSIEVCDEGGSLVKTIDLNPSWHTH